MKKLFVVAVLCGLISVSCSKKEDETFCYVCSTTAKEVNGSQETPLPDLSIEVEQCGWTEEQASAASSTLTSTAGGMTMKVTTACKKK